MPRLAGRVADLKPSATVEMTERVRAARAAGRRIIGLSSGDPNLPTDPRVIEAAERAIRDGDTHYGPAAGLPALRAAIAQHEWNRAGARYDPADILVTPGGKFALLTALMSVVQPGDEVLVPEPGWVSYAPCIRLCGGTPVVLPMLDHIDLDQLAAAVTPRTVAIILNSPVNPTGRVLDAAELNGVLAMAERHDVWVIFDQVYCDLLHEGTVPFPQATEAGRTRTFVVDSFSKTFGMTGWRLGSLALPTGVARTVQRFIQHSIYCVPGFIQTAGLVALSLYDELTPGYRALFRGRQVRAAARLSTVPGVTCSLPQAGFYLFPAVAKNDAQVAARWLDELSIATVPGSAFGAAGAGHLRLALSCPDEQLDEALDLIVKAGL